MGEAPMFNYLCVRLRQLTLKALIENVYENLFIMSREKTLKDMKRSLNQIDIKKLSCIHIRKGGVCHVCSINRKNPFSFLRCK